MLDDIPFKEEKSFFLVAGFFIRGIELPSVKSEFVS